jgi:hypothetical protein
MEQSLVSPTTQSEQLSPQMQEFASRYAEYVEYVYPDLDPEWRPLLSHIMVNKILYGVTYASRIEQVLDTINAVIEREQLSQTE